MVSLLGVEATASGLLCAASALGAALLYLYLTWTYDFWKKRGVPYMRPQLLFGTIKDIMLARQCSGEMFRRQYEQFPNERFVGGFRLRAPSLLLRDLELVKAVLVRDFDAFTDRPFAMDERAMPLSLHLVNLRGRRWRALRAKLRPVFTPAKIALMFPLVEECAEALLEHLRPLADPGVDLEVYEVMCQFMTDVIASCVMGVKTNAIGDPDNAFRRVGRLMFRPSLSGWLRRALLTNLTPLAVALGMRLESRAVTDFFTGAVRDMKAQRLQHGVKRNDFIDLLLQLQRSGRVDGQGGDDDADKAVADEINMTDNLLASQVFLFFIAGFETSATASSFALYQLALHPELQERLRDEVDATLARHGGALPHDAVLNEMRYLDMVWSETLRMHPPLNHLQRCATQDYTLPGTDVRLPKGTLIDIPMMGIHYDPQYYPDPERFDPERFSDEEKAKRPNFAFLPFGEGPRYCIGMRFGHLQGKLSLAKLLAHFRFVPCARTAVPLRLNPLTVVTAPIGSIWLRVEPR